MRLESPQFWGGEVEILILSKMLRVPIHVMQSAKEAGRWVAMRRVAVTCIICPQHARVAAVQIGCLARCLRRVRPLH